MPQSELLRICDRCEQHKLLSCTEFCSGSYNPTSRSMLNIKQKRFVQPVGKYFTLRLNCGLDG